MSAPSDIMLVQGDTTPFLPTSGKILIYAKTNGTFYSMTSDGVETPLSGGSGGSGVSTVSVVPANGISGLVANATTTPAITLSLGDITPNSVSALGTVSGSNLSGTNTGDETASSIKTKLGITTLSGSNTGDQTITLTGDVSGSGTGSFVTTLATVNLAPQTNAFRKITVTDKGLVTETSAVTGSDITAVLGFTPYNATNPSGFTSNVGTVTSIAADGANGVTVSGSPITTSGTITVGLNNITPTSVAALGSVTGLNLSGTNTGDETTASIKTKLGITTLSGSNTGDQTTITGNAGSATVLESARTISATGDATWSVSFDGSANVTSGLTLAASGVTANTYGSATEVPVVTVDSKGRITNVTLATIPTTGGGSGTVTSVAATGNDGITVSGSPITDNGTLTFGLGNITPTSVSATGPVTGTNLSGTNTGDETATSIKTALGITTLSGSNTGDQTITLTGDVTGSGTGSFATTLATVNISPQADAFRKVTVNGKGLVTATSPVTSSDITDVLGFTPYNATNPSGFTSNTGTVTSVAATGSNGVTVSGSPITDDGTLTIGLGAITPSSVTSTGAVTGSNLSGTNTGDETEASIKTALGITILSGDNTGDQTTITGNAGSATILESARTISATGDATWSVSFDGSTDVTAGLTLAASGVVAGTYGTDTTVSSITVDAKGRITSAVDTPITFPPTVLPDVTTAGTYGSTTEVPVVTVDSKGRITGVTLATIAGGGTGTVTSVAATGNDGITVSGSPITDNGTLTFGLGDITPTSVAATGAVSGSNLSGTNTGDETEASIKTALGITVLSGDNTGDQTITLTGDVTGSGTGSFAATLSDTTVVPGTYTLSTITVDSKGRITSASTGSAGSGTGTVTSVDVSGGSTGLTFSGGPVTDSGTVTMAGTLAIASGGTGATTQNDAANAILPSQAGNAGMVLSTDGTNTSWTTVGGSSSSVEIVVFRYSPGASGTLTLSDAIYSSTSGVTPVISDGANSIVQFSFTGKTFPPKSIMMYGQLVASNRFVIKTPVNLATSVMTDGGTVAAPDIVNGLFTPSNVITLTCSPAITGASGAVGVRAYALVQFGF